jgi:uncharacterized delta-60 repeat protein
LRWRDEGEIVFGIHGNQVRRRGVAYLAAGVALVSLGVSATAATADQTPNGRHGFALSAAGARFGPVSRWLAVAPSTLGRAGTGDPDPDVFGVDGKVGVHGSSTSDDMLVGLSLYPDGRIVASGYREEAFGEFSTVTRRNRDGSPDATFGDGTGVVSVKGLNGPALKTVPTADGGLVGVGYTVTTDQPDVVAFRLDAAGQLVDGFGRGGLVQFPTAGPDLAVDVAVQPDGKVVLAGTRAPSFEASAISVRRLLADGTPDPAFGVAGEVLVRVSTFDTANGIVLQRDGRILVTGESDETGVGIAARINRDGSMDRSFGLNGVTTLRAREVTQAFRAVVQTDGRIDIAGFTRTPGVAGDAVVFRLLADGRPDPSFGRAGQVILSNEGHDFGFGIGLEPDNSIVVTSYQAQRPDTVTDAFLNRITPAGKLDPRFGTDGTVRVHNPEASFAFDLSIQPDAKIVVAGRRGGFNIVDSIGTIDRFRPDGSYDTTS